MGLEGRPELEGKRVVWSPLPGFQVRFLSCGAYEALGGGAAGPGKTDCLIAYQSALAQHPATRALVLRTTYTDLRDVLDRMAVLYPQLGATWNADARRWTFPSGGTVETGYGESMGEIARYLGREFTSIGWDEIGLLGDERVYLELLSRVRSTDATVPLRVRLSANPGGPGHAWLKRRFIGPCGRDGSRVYRDPDTGETRAFVPGTLRDNPLLPDSYRRRLMALPPLRRRQLMDGDWDAAGGLYFEDLRPDALLIPRLDRGDGPGRWDGLPDWWTYWAAYDWGYRHWMTCGAFAKDGDGTIYLLDTLWLRRRSDEEQAVAVRSFLPAACRPNIVAGLDAFARRQAHAAAPETVEDVFGRHDLYLTRAVVDRVPGWQAVARAVTTRQPDGSEGQPILRVCDTEGNRRLLEQVGELVVDPDDTRDVLKVDADPDSGAGGDDGADMLRYGLATGVPGGVAPVPFDPRRGNTATGEDGPLPWESWHEQQGMRAVEFRPRPPGVDGQFGDGWGL